MELNELVASMAILEERGQLEELDEAAYPSTGSIRWLFGLTAGLYFAKGETRRTREAMLNLALRYYDLADGNTNLLAYGERTRRISSKEEVDPPPVKWSAVMIRKRRIENGQQATEAGRDCLEVAAG